MAEAVFDGQVQLRRAEQAVEDVFQPGAVQVVQLVSSDHLHISQQVGGVFVCACDAGSCMVRMPSSLALLDAPVCAVAMDTDGTV